jgi:hypothetical protein
VGFYYYLKYLIPHFTFPARANYYPRWVDFTASPTSTTAERFATLNAFVYPAGPGNLIFSLLFFFDCFSLIVKYIGIREGGTFAYKRARF